MLERRGVWWVVGAENIKYFLCRVPVLVNIKGDLFFSQVQTSDQVLCDFVQWHVTNFIVDPKQFAGLYLCHKLDRTHKGINLKHFGTLVLRYFQAQS